MKAKATFMNFKVSLVHKSTSPINYYKKVHYMYKQTYKKLNIQRLLEVKLKDSTREVVSYAESET